MFSIQTAEQAIGLIKDGDTIAINSFLSLNNPEALHSALAENFERTGHPNNLELFCASGFGGWDEHLYADRYIKAGAVRCIIAGHFKSMPAAMELAKKEKIEAYNLPLGVLSHTLPAAASGKDGYLCEVGLGLFVDPRLEGPGLNSISKRVLLKVVELEGKEYLYYKTPKIDIAFLKGTTVDPNGNITFEKECLTVDALAMAQATKANGGKVIVQVERVSHLFERPRNVIIPGILVDVVVVCADQKQVLNTAYNPTLSGDIHVPSSQMNYWMSQLSLSGKRAARERDISHEIIGERAAKELKKGDIVNIGIGIPENVGRAAAQMDILNDITLTVESGGIGGLPAPGVAFGATIGADAITDMSQQFDFYDGGGLDICFMGAVEADSRGNVNAHKIGHNFVGIGGFANITYATKTVVFCLNFTTRGLHVEREADGTVVIEKEGATPKFRKAVQSISFNGERALKKGQRVLYVTERCVFSLSESGLMLEEVYKGIDIRTQILDLIDFEIEINPRLKKL
jgi:propionate CoA-transferase